MWSSFDLQYFSGHDTHGLLAVILSVFSALLLAVSFKICHRGTLPPGPRGIPLLGYLPFLGKELHREFETLARVYGPIYSLWLGNKLCVVVSSPELVKEVIRNQDALFANRDPTVSTFIGSYGGNDIAFGSYGPQWKKLRKVFVQEMMSKRTLDNSYKLRREEVFKSVRRIYEMTNSEVEISSLSFATMTNMLLSQVGSSSAMDVRGFKAAMAETMVLFGRPNVSDFFPFLARFDLQGIGRDTHKVIGVLGNLYDADIEEKRRVMDGRPVDHQKDYDFLEFLLELHQNQDDTTSVTRTEIMALLANTFTGGAHTTTSVVEWAMAELLRHPQELKKVQRELTQVVGLSRMVEESDLADLPYLATVIKETLRLHPSAPFLVPRSPSADTTLGGYTIPKGCRVFPNVWAIHRDPAVWENPLEFKPERFAGDRSSDYAGSSFDFLPFGSGRRICPGIPLAERMTGFVLASLLHCFEWRLPDDVTEIGISDKFGIVIMKLEPLMAIPTPRLSDLDLYM